MGYQIEKLTENLNIHQSLADQPPLSAEELKRTWDRPANMIKNYINDKLIEGINKILEDEIGDLKRNMLNEVYPIGITVAFNDDEDHTNFCGLKWEKVAQGKFIVGASDDPKNTTYNSAGQTGGSMTKTITKDNLPNYNLPLNDPGHNHAIPALSGGSKIGALTVDRGNNAYASDYARTGITVNSGGKGTPLDVMPAYEVKVFWTRVS